MRGEILVPVAVLGGEDDVRAAVGVGQTVDPAEGVRHRRAAGGGHAEGHGFRAELGGGAPQFVDGEIHGLLPRDAAPARIAAAFGPRAHQRMEQGDARYGPVPAPRGP